MIRTPLATSIPQYVENPILRRELRARWRGWRGYYPLLLAAVVLALGMTGLYAINVQEQALMAARSASYAYSGQNYNDYGATGSGVTVDVARAQLAQAGHSIFLYLMMGQGVLCLLLAPALTASSIANEREAGLLEALQLSSLNGWGVARGKLGAALSLGGVLLLLPLPAVAVCFFLGGVSPMDLLLSLALQSSIFCCGACAGLFFGSRNRGALSAYLDAYFYVGFYCFVTGSLAAALGSMSPYGRSLFTGPYPLMGAQSDASFTFSDVLCGLNPLTALFSAAGENNISGSLPCTWAWTIGLFSQAAVSIFCFVLAARRVAVPLPDRNAETAPAVGTHTAQQAESGGSLWNASVAMPTSAAAIKAAASATSHDESASQAASTARRWHELPLESWLKFANPVLQRETRARFRLQLPLDLTRRNLWQPLLAGGFMLYVGLVRWLIQHSSADALCTLLLYAVMSLALILPAVFAATAFSRERERDTWLALHLSLLPTSQLVRGKFAAVLLVYGLYTLPLWPPLLIAGGKSLGSQVLLIPLVVAAIASFSATLGMWLSWRCRRTVTAVCLSLVMSFLWTVATPTVVSFAASTLINTYNPSPYGGSRFYEVAASEPNIIGSSAVYRYDTDTYLAALHPSQALLALNDASQHRAQSYYPEWYVLGYRTLSPGAACAISAGLMLFMSALATLGLERALRRQREPRVRPYSRAATRHLYSATSH